MDTPHRVRCQGRDDITIIQKHLPARDQTRYFGIPSATVRRALVDCSDLIMASRLREAAHAARAEGLLTVSEWNTLTEELQLA